MHTNSTARFDMTSGSGGLHHWCSSLASVFPVTNTFTFSHNQQSCILQVCVHHFATWPCMANSLIFATWPCMANSIIFANMTYIQWKDIHIYLSSPRFGSLSSSVINDEAPLDPTGLKSILARSLERWNKKYVMIVYLQPYHAFPKCISKQSLQLL